MCKEPAALDEYAAFFVQLTALEQACLRGGMCFPKRKMRNNIEFLRKNVNCVKVILYQFIIYK